MRWHKSIDESNQYHLRKNIPRALLYGRFDQEVKLKLKSCGICPFKNERYLFLITSSPFYHSPEVIINYRIVIIGLMQGK